MMCTKFCPSNTLCILRSVGQNFGNKLLFGLPGRHPGIFFRQKSHKKRNNFSERAVSSQKSFSYY